MKRLLRLVVAMAFVAVAAIGVVTLLDSPTEAGRCVCPQVYAPVECDKGKVYPNQCVADCRRAKNCVPTGVI